MKQEFEITDEELKELMEAGKPTMVIYGSGGVPLGGNPQDNANYAWQRLGEKRGFVWDTAEPAPGKSNKFFRATPIEKKAEAADARI